MGVGRGSDLRTVAGREGTCGGPRTGATTATYYRTGWLTTWLPASFPYLRNLCGNLLCCKASHWWAKPTGRWKPKPRKAKRGRVRQLSDRQIQRIRLLDSFGSDEDEIGLQFGLTKRQVAQIAMGKVRPEAGGPTRSSRFKGIRYYHDEHERELLSLSMRPDESPGPQPISVISNGETRPVPTMSYGRMPRPRYR